MPQRQHVTIQGVEALIWCVDSRNIAREEKPYNCRVSLSDLFAILGESTVASPLTLQVGMLEVVAGRKDCIQRYPGLIREVLKC